MPDEIKGYFIGFALVVGIVCIYNLIRYRNLKRVNFIALAIVLVTSILAYFVKDRFF